MTVRRIVIANDPSTVTAPASAADRDVCALENGAPRPNAEHAVSTSTHGSAM
jgi:hypothetical protein